MSGVFVRAAAAMSKSVQQYSRIGEAMWTNMDKVSSDLLTLMYGALVTELVRDYEDIKVVNTELEKMGFNIGVRR